jgi:hypothetical protein
LRGRGQRVGTSNNRGWRQSTTGTVITAYSIIRFSGWLAAVRPRQRQEVVAGAAAGDGRGEPVLPSAGVRRTFPLPSLWGSGADRCCQGRDRSSVPLSQVGKGPGCANRRPRRQSLLREGDRGRPARRSSGDGRHAWVPGVLPGQTSPYCRLGVPEGETAPPHGMGNADMGRRRHRVPTKGRGRIRAPGRRLPSASRRTGIVGLCGQVV